MTSRRSLPTRPGAAFQEFMDKSRRLEGQRLTEAIPREYFTPRPARGLLGFAVSWALYAGSVLGLVFAPRWLLYPPLLLTAGLGGWGLHCIAHDCGHGSFSRSRRLNVAVGHLALLPLLYPFHSWRHVHNMHHSHTNNLELDTDWRPLPPALYERLSPWGRAVYVGTRTWAFWGGTIRYWAVSGYRPGFFPKRSMRREVWRSIAFTGPVCLAYLVWLTAVTGPGGLLLYFVLPWVAIHLWFSATTLMHHSASDLPYLTSEHWTRNAGRLLLTTDYTYPRALSFLTHNIATHTAHHVAPAIPFYHLPQAQQALKRAYPGMVREQRLSPRGLWTILRSLHLYDEQAGFYQDFAHNKVPAEDNRD
ncbi:fatty acid desaturase [Saccharopolyspora hattusasensis]|uniref:fatty acid desaturase n=1 Tax=Saccharopolyspora hattusasensis TaxID=1128679 RepID=UPI003D96111A